MSDSSNRIAAALEQAIQAESDGYHFYFMTSHSTEDPKAKEVFARLAEEEMQHARFLRRQHRAILETGRPDETASLGPRKVVLAGPSPIFSPGLRSRVKEAHLEMSALSIGIQLELDSERFYREQARQSHDDPAVRRFFEELADWESGHYAALRAQMDELKEDYWNQGGFAPF